MTLVRHMRSLWRHVAFNYGQGGVTQVAMRFVTRLKAWTWSETQWFVYRSEPSRGPVGKTQILSRRELNLADLLRLRYFKALAFPELTQKRIDSGDACQGFFQDQELVHVCWITKDCLKLEPGVAISHCNSVGIADCYTIPEHRAKGVYTSALRQLIDSLPEDHSALIAVEPWNYASIKGIERAGFKRVLDLTRTRRIGMQHLSYRVTGGAVDGLDAQVAAFASHS